jgi:hypothetical protein
MPSRRLSPADYGLTKVSYSHSELKEILPYKDGFIYKLVRTGQLKRSKSGRKSIYYAIDIVAHIEATRRGAA